MSEAPAHAMSPVSPARPRPFGTIEGVQPGLRTSQTPRAEPGFKA
jgi:hypothetical protein